MSSIQLRVNIIDTKPLIWRRILVPADVSAYEFHHILQHTMGWCNRHLFEFHYSFFQLSLVDEMGETIPVGKGKSDMEKVTLGEMAGQVRNSFIYLYDIGDNWEHRVTVEEFSDQKLDHAICLEGERACPPEDCGGVPGYYEMLKMLKNKFHKDHLMWTKWLKEYDPNWEKNRFDIDEVNENLKKFRDWL